VCAVDCAPDGRWFVTCGERHIKFWYLKGGHLEGKPASILEQHKLVTFTDIHIGRSALQGSIFASTSTGVLCTFSHDRVIERWVQLEAEMAYCVSASTHVAVGCTNGTVRLFHPETLEYVCTLPYPCPVSQSAAPKYAAAVGVRTLHDDKIAVLYADRSIFTWDVKDPLKPSRFRSFLFHRGCIWDVQFLGRGRFESNDSSTRAVPAGSFVTCAADNTIRFWNADASASRKSR
jgi:WD40 repeat protein